MLSFRYHSFLAISTVNTMINFKQFKHLNSLRSGLAAMAQASILTLAVSVLPTAQAQTTVTPTASQTAIAQPISLDDFFKRSQFREFKPSPDGNFVATTAEVNGRFNLIIIDLAAKTASAITNWNNIDVGNIEWASNERILYSAVQLGAPTGQDTPRAGGLFVVSRDGKVARQLAKTAAQQNKGGSTGIAGLELLAPIPGNTEEILANGVVLNDDRSVDVYRINLLTGKDRLITQGRPADGIQRWVLDNKLVPRVAIAETKGSSTELVTYYRSNATSDWKVLRKFDQTQSPAFVPLDFDDDDKTMFVATNEGRNNMAIYRFDPETNKLLELVAQHPQYDMGASPNGSVVGKLMFDPKTNQLRGLTIDADKPTVIWLDPKIAQVQTAIDQTFPGLTNDITLSSSGKYFVTSYSDSMPGRYYVYDAEKRNLEMLGAAAPWLEGKLAQIIPFKLKTRDGLEIPSYYVLPKGYKPGTKLRTVVHIHGGPMARDIEQGGRYGYSFGSREAQILANRGYAVVLPNFRITPELGSKIYYAGFGTYGKQMSDDHEDAVKWAIDQGFADPKKICISGASYGGYAALHAATRPTNPFACAISGLPVTDLNWQRSNADYGRFPTAVEYWRKVQGVPNFSDPSVRALSPLFNADKIKIPVFMYVGEDDTRTPPKQAERMRDAMAAAGNPMKDYFIGKEEGHGYGVIKTNIELYERMFKFLDAALK
jgi:dipeptidyl aminopeptidase/acylaminoacyl peptidase